MLNENLLAWISNLINLQYNYGVFERLEIALSNIIFLSLIFFIFFLLKFFYSTQKLVKVFFILFIILNLIQKINSTYTYDTSLALIFILIDLLFILMSLYFIGYIINKSKRINYLYFSDGLSFIIFISSILVSFNINYYISLPSYYFYIFSSFFIIYFTVFKFKKGIFNFNRIYFIYFLILLIPFSLYSFVPAPPDADITTVSEIIGYLFQGANLFHAQTGISDSWIFIRYPNGLPSVSWLFSHLLNVRSSEVLLLFWFLSYFLLIFNLAKLGKHIGLPVFVIIIFSLNTTINGRYGLTGGQLQEILAYALGIAMINNLIIKKNVASTFNINAAILTHPIVSIPFIIIYFFYMLFNFTNVSIIKKNINEIFAIFLIFTYPILYYLYLSLGYTENISIIHEALSNVNLKKFFYEMYRNIQSDTFGFSFFILIIFYAFSKKIINKDFFIISLLWILGSMLIDGFFRSHPSGPFSGSLSIIGLWILSVSIFFKILYEQLRIKTTYIKITLLLITYLFICFPSININYFSVFTTHAEIKISRYIEKNLTDNDLIVNVRPPNEWGPWNYVRGNTGKHTTYARISEHQIKKGIIKQGPNFLECYNNSNLNYNLKKFESSLFHCLKSKGATHLLIISRHSSAEFIKKLNSKPIVNYGESYLYEL